MAKRSKSKARKKALKLAEKPSNTPVTTVIANQPKKAPNTPKKAPDTVIIDDHSKSSLTSTKAKTPPNDPLTETFTDKSVAVLRVAAVVLVVLIVVLMVCLWFFYGRVHKASFYNSSSLVLKN